MESKGYREESVSGWRSERVISRSGPIASSVPGRCFVGAGGILADGLLRNGLKANGIDVSRAAFVAGLIEDKDQASLNGFGGGRCL